MSYFQVKAAQISFNLTVPVGATDWMLPQGNELVLPGGSGTIPTDYQEYSDEEVITDIQLSKEPLFWFTETSKKTGKLPATISPSSQIAIDSAKVSEVVEIGDRVSISNVSDMAQFGSAIHAVIAVNMIHDKSIDNNLVQNILNSHKVEASIAVSDAIKMAERFRNFTRDHLKAKRVLLEYPIEYKMPNGQHAAGWIDTLVETDEGYVIVDHKSSPKSRAESSKDALKYSGQLNLYKEAVEVITGMPVQSCWIHFAVIGLAVEVHVNS